MNKSIPFMVVLGLVLSGLGASALQKTDVAEEKIVTETMTISEPILTMRDRFIEVTIPEMTSSLLRVGQPKVPVVTSTFALPWDSVVRDVSVDFGTTVVMSIEKPVQPAPKPVIEGIGHQVSPELVCEETVYAQEALYPSEPYSYAVHAGLQGESHMLFVSVQCYPVRYLPSDNVLEYSRSLEIQVTYEPPVQPVQFSDEYDLVIIAPEEFAETLQPLVDHKNTVGMNALLKTTETIYDEYTGRDKPEQIKYFIKDAIETYGITYVLLVGGMMGQQYDWYLPVRETNNHAGKPYEEGFISDLYYADVYKYEDNETVFEDWDSNENDVFAEFTMLNKDVLDCLPDVRVGRVACRTLSQVEVMVDKIIAYESSQADPSWFNRFLLVAGDTYPDNGAADAYEAEIDTNVSASYMDDFEITRLWASTGALTGQSDVEAAINEGYGFVHMAGHANPAILVTNTPNAENGKITILRMYNMPLMNAIWALGREGVSGAIQRLLEPRNPRLSNGEKQPVIVIGGCHNSQFNTTLLNIRRLGFSHAYGYGVYVPKCFSWYLASLENDGAIATMGNTGLGMGLPGYSYPDGLDGWLFPRFFYHYGELDEHILGDPFSNAIHDYALEFDVNNNDAERQMIEQWALLGDPSLMIGGYAR